jgi:hypothetical protein
VLFEEKLLKVYLPNERLFSKIDESAYRRKSDTLMELDNSQSQNSPFSCIKKIAYSPLEVNYF